MNIIQAELKFAPNHNYGNIVEKLVIHHAFSKSCTIYDIDSWHKENGWAGCGYHYFVRKDGSVYQGRPDNMVGCHSGEGNYRSLGICFEGNFEAESMEVVQFMAGKELIKFLSNKYNITTDKIYRHKKFMQTSCPGKFFPLEEMINGSLDIKPVENNKGGCKLLEKCKSNPVSYGSKSNYVLMLQTMLLNLNYNPNGVDGHCGNGMVKAIKLYQGDNGLVVDGSFGPACWNHIFTR